MIKSKRLKNLVKIEGKCGWITNGQIMIRNGKVKKSDKFGARIFTGLRINEIAANITKQLQPAEIAYFCDETPESSLDVQGGMGISRTPIGKIFTEYSVIIKPQSSDDPNLLCPFDAEYFYRGLEDLKIKVKNGVRINFKNYHLFLSVNEKDSLQNNCLVLKNMDTGKVMIILQRLIPFSIKGQPFPGEKEARALGFIK